MQHSWDLIDGICFDYKYKFDSFNTLWLGWNDLLTLLLWQGYQAENLVFHFIQGSKFVYVGIEASMHLNPDKTFFLSIVQFQV